MKEINLYTPYINDRDVPRIEGVIADMLTIHLGKDDDIIAEKIRDALYVILGRLYTVSFQSYHEVFAEMEGCDYRVSVQKAEPEKFDFCTWGD